MAEMTKPITLYKESHTEEEGLCPECGHGKFNYDHVKHEKSCLKCGFTTRDEEFFDMTRPEKHTSSLEEWRKLTHVGPPIDISYHDKGLPTKIGQENRDALGRKLSFEARKQVKRLKKWEKKLRYDKDWSLKTAMVELQKLKDKLNTPKTILQEAARVYRKARKKSLIRGHSIKAFSAATLYAAYRRYKIPIPLKEIARLSSVKKKDVGRCYRLIIDELDYNPSLLDDASYISLIAERSKISEKTLECAIEIYNEAKIKGHKGGRDPMGVAGATIYIACSENGEKRSQKEIARFAGVTEVTIRNRYESIKKLLLN